MPASSYKNLRAWQVSMEVAELVYRTTKEFPRHEIYGLAGQMQRAAVSLPSNIAEGHARDSTREFLHHISMALGSLAELETQLLLAKKLEYLSSNMSDCIREKVEESGRTLRGLQKSLKAKLQTL